MNLPNTPAGEQARWLFGAVTDLPIPVAEVTADFDAAFLARVPPPAAASLNGTFAGLTTLKLDSITTSTPDALVFVVIANGTELSVSISDPAVIADIAAWIAPGGMIGT